MPGDRVPRAPPHRGPPASADPVHRGVERRVGDVIGQAGANHAGGAWVIVGSAEREPAQATLVVEVAAIGGRDDPPGLHEVGLDRAGSRMTVDGRRALQHRVGSQLLCIQGV